MSQILLFFLLNYFFSFQDEKSYLQGLLILICTADLPESRHYVKPYSKIAMAETHAKIPLDPTRFSRSGLGPAAVLERLKAAVLEMPRAGGRYMRVFDERCFFWVLGVFLPSLRFISLSVLGLLWRFYLPLFHEFGWCLRETFVVSVYFGGVDSWRLLQDRPCYTARLGWSWGEPGSPRQPGSGVAGWRGGWA